MHGVKHVIRVKIIKFDLEVWLQNVGKIMIWQNKVKTELYHFHVIIP